MASKGTKKYCYLTPDFPREAFIVGVFFITKSTPLMITPLHVVSSDLEVIPKSVEDFKCSIQKSQNKDAKEILEIFNTVMLIPITLQKLYPLKKEFWTKSKKEGDFQERIYAFVPALAHLNLYKLLVTPFNYIKKLNHWEFSALYPFSVFSDDSEIEKYMYASKEIVEIKAKYAAIYSFGIPKRLNLETGEVTEVEKEIPEKSKIVN